MALTGFWLVAVCFLLTIKATLQLAPSYIDCANEMNTVVTSYIDKSLTMIPPQKPSSPLPVTLKAQMVVVELHGIETEEQTLSMTAMLKLSWTDFRLSTVNSGTFFGAVCASKNYTSWGYIVEAVNRLPWYPQWVVSNGGKGVLLHGAWDYYPAIVHSDGLVEWWSMYHMETECIQDAFYFPSDYQKCNITVSWPTTDNHILHVVVPDKKSIVLHEQSSSISSLWQLNGQMFQPGNSQHFTSMTFCLLLSRRSLFYIGAMMMPILLINCMVVCGMLMPPLAPKKIVVAFFNLSTVFLTNIEFYDFLPRTSDNNKSPVVLYFFVCHTFLALAATAFICVISRISEFREKNEKSHKIERMDMHLMTEMQKAEEELELAQDEWVKGSFIGGCTGSAFQKFNFEKVNTIGGIAYAILCLLSYIFILGYIYGMSAVRVNKLLSSGYEPVPLDEHHH